MSRSSRDNNPTSDDLPDSLREWIEREIIDETTKGEEIRKRLAKLTGRQREIVDQQWTRSAIRLNALRLYLATTRNNDHDRQKGCEGRYPGLPDQN